MKWCCLRGCLARQTRHRRLSDMKGSFSVKFYIQALLFHFLSGIFLEKSFLIFINVTDIRNPAVLKCFVLTNCFARKNFRQPCLLLQCVISHAFFLFQKVFGLSCLFQYNFNNFCLGFLVRFAKSHHFDSLLFFLESYFLYGQHYKSRISFLAEYHNIVNPITFCINLS